MELFEFSLSSDETAAAGSQWLARHAAQPPNSHRRIDTLEAHVADRVADCIIAERAADAVGNQGFTGLGRCHEPRGEIDRIAMHCVVLHIRTSERARDN